MKRSLLALFCFTALAATAFAVSTSFYQESGIRDFETGRFEGISVNDNGELYLAPSLKTLLDKNDLFVWDIVRGAGGDIFAATGVKGNIWRVTPKGDATLFANVNTMTVRALATGRDGRLFAGASGPARVIAFDAAGKQTIIARPNATYIWDMATGPDGKLYLACGNPALLVRVDPVTGALEQLFSAKTESHFLALGINAAGSVYLGSEGNGILYKWTPDGKTKAMYDCYEDEISCLTVGSDGRVWFGTATQRRRMTGGNFNFTDSHEMREREQRRDEARESDDDEAKKKKRVPHKNSIYRLNNDDSVEKVFTLSDTSFFSLALDARGNLHAGSGDYGVIYRIDKSGKTSRMLRLDENQVLALIFDGDRLVAGSGNDGRLRTLDFSQGLAGTYTSRVLDCRANVTFGSISWTATTPAGSSLALATRSGNTNPPDATWSPWSAPYTKADGEKISNPRARYVQYRVEMKSATLDTTPVLGMLKIPFVHDNRAPRVKGVTVTTYSEAKAEKKLKLNPGQLAITWQAEDDDNDTLASALYFRMDNDAAWRFLKVDTQQNQTVLNSEQIADGWYQFRVVASDRPGNPDALAKTALADSRRVLVDNTAPVIEGLKSVRNGDKIVVSGRIVDAFSHVSMLRFSLNAEDWVYSPSADGVFDATTEEFSFEISLKDCPQLVNGSNLLLVRACDSQENWTTARLLIQVELPAGARGLGNERKYFHLEN